MGECHRARTRTARQRLDDLFYPVIERNDINFVLETSCPLARELDMLRPFEELKRMKRRGEWQCQKCSKIFRGEDYLDKQRSPVFVQFLDCVWQILKQFPRYFEYRRIAFNFALEIADRDDFLQVPLHTRDLRLNPHPIRPGA